MPHVSCGGVFVHPHIHVRVYGCVPIPALSQAGADPGMTTLLSPHPTPVLGGLGSQHRQMTVRDGGMRAVLQGRWEGQAESFLPLGLGPQQAPGTRPGEGPITLQGLERRDLEGISSTCNRIKGYHQKCQGLGDPGRGA